MGKQITRLEIKNFLGVQELGIEPGKINIFKGPKGIGKSTILEAIEKGFSNKNRRTEVVRHGEEEATIFIQLSDGVSVDRKIRTNVSDYLKIRKEDGSVPSTEKFLRSLINGEIFRPLDWVNMDIKEQTKSILNMLNIAWSMEDIKAWFGEETVGIDYNQHILQVLKAIELKYYKDREEVNRKIKELEARIDVIHKELPADYNGEEWRDKKVQEYYKAVSDAQEINRNIEIGKGLIENFNAKISAIEAAAESDKNKKKLEYSEKRQDIKDIIELSKGKIEKAYSDSLNFDNQLKLSLEAIDNDVEIRINEAIRKIKEEAEATKNAEIESVRKWKANLKDTISINENKISAKEQELISLDSLEGQELTNIESEKIFAIEKEKIRVGKASEYMENHEPIDIEPLQTEADTVADMQSYLRQWDMMIDIRDNQLAEKERYSDLLTNRIAQARNLPQELLKSAQMPVEGINVDEKGLIRINGTLVGDLSDGEKLSLSFEIAKAQAGELKVICLDKFESLNPKYQEQLLSEMEKDSFQYFITNVSDTDNDSLEIEKRG
jgi:energy-coupling factor transporter ATP-binding protein EcfA2